MKSSKVAIRHYCAICIGRHDRLGLTLFRIRRVGRVQLLSLISRIVADTFMVMSPSFHNVILDWLADQIRGQGFWRASAVVIAVLSGLIGLGLVTDTQRLITWGLVALAAMLVLVVVTQAISRGLLSRDLQRRSRALDRYAQKLTARQRNNPKIFETTNWREEISINKRGDATIKRWFDVMVGADESLDAFWSVQSVNNSRPPTMRERRRIHMRSHSWADGELGAEFDVDLRWENASQCKAFVFFDEEVPPGSSVGIYVEWSWPRHFKDFVSGEMEPFRWSFRLKAAQMNCAVRLAEDIAPRGVRITNMPGGPKARAVREADGSTLIEFKIDRPTPDKTYRFTAGLI